MEGAQSSWKDGSWHEKKQVPGQTHTSASRSTQRQGCDGDLSIMRTEWVSLAPRHQLSEAFKASLLG